MKILYISYYYPPYNTIGGLRSYGQVQALRESGCEVKVITSSQQGFEKDNTSSFSGIDSNVFYLNKERKEQDTKDLNSFSFLKKIIIRLPRFVNRYIYLLKFLVLGENKNWCLVVKSDYKKILQDWNPDLIFSSQSPISSHMAASFISKDLDVRWVAEFRDSWSFNPMAFSNSENDLSSIVMRVIEKRILDNCSVILGATSFIQRYYDKYYDINNYLLLGGWDPNISKETELSASKNTNTNRKIRVTHLGSMLYGRRSITPIIDMLNSNKNIVGSYNFEFIGRHTSFFKELLENTDAKKSLTLNEHVPYLEAEKYGYSTDVLLILMMDSPQEKYTLTGKIFDYIKYHKPIIIVDPFKSEASKLVLDYKMGHVFKDFKDLEVFLESCNSIDSFNKISAKDRDDFKRITQITNLISYLNSNP